MNFFHSNLLISLESSLGAHHSRTEYFVFSSGTFLIRPLQPQLKLQVQLENHNLFNNDGETQNWISFNFWTPTFSIYFRYYNELNYIWYAVYNHDTGSKLLNFATKTFMWVKVFYAIVNGPLIDYSSRRNIDRPNIDRFFKFAAY